MGPRTRRLLKSFLLVLVMLLVGLVIAAYTTLTLSVPPAAGTLPLPGLQQPVEITIDSMGIPQIWAHSEHDGYFALGWRHAADRLFQMDMMRRVSQGRLSEVLGDITLDIDIEQRRAGHNRLAAAAMADLSAVDRRRLQAYTDGINAYTSHCKTLPFEFYLLPGTFEEWTVFDCLAAFSFEIWLSDALQNREDFYRELTRKVGCDRAQQLIAEYPSWAPTTIEGPGRAAQALRSDRNDSSGRRQRNATPAPTHLVPLRRQMASSSLRSPREAVARSLLAGSIPRLTCASNAWVVAPDRSAGGHAMLASDPHLQLTRLPQFWHAVGLHVKETGLAVLGITVPGLPFITMGHNGKAAWAFTAAGVDITDYYEETIHPVDTSLYLICKPSGSPDSTVDSTWRAFDVYYDTIQVLGRDSAVHMQTRHSHHGPLVPNRSYGGHAYALRWSGSDADLSAAISGAFDLMEVADFETFQEVVTRMSAINASWLYADAEGSIGYQLGAAVPVRSTGNFYCPHRGSNPAYDWQGYLPLAETPHVENPTRGWIASANNRPSWSPDVPGTYAADRILRISQLLESQPRFTAEDMQRFQMDQHDAHLLRWSSDIAALLDSVDQPAAAAGMRNWDGSSAATSYQTGMAVEFLGMLQEGIFKDELGGLAPRVKSVTTDRVFHCSQQEWLDNRRTAKVVEASFDIGKQALQRVMIDSVGKPWGEMQSLSMQHPMAAVPVIGSILRLTRGPWPRGGTAGTLNSSFSRRSRDGTYRVTVGPSWRFVIDFADIDAATMVLPAGNSGNPMSPHFFDFNELWRTGGRWTVPFTESLVRDRAAGILILSPGAEETPEAGRSDPAATSARCEEPETVY